MNLKATYPLSFAQKCWVVPTSSLGLPSGAPSEEQDAEDEEFDDEARPHTPDLSEEEELGEDQELPDDEE